MRPDLDPDHSAEDSDDEEGGKQIKWNPHRSAAGAPQDCKDSDSPGTDSLGEESRILRKACRPSAKRGVGTLIAGAASPSAASAVGRPSLYLCTWRGCWHAVVLAAAGRDRAGQGRKIDLK